MSRLSVGNLINHTSQSTGAPISVPLAHPPAHPQPPPLQVHRYFENGREYYAVNNTIAYPFPCDELEDDRLDYFHSLIHDWALSSRLHFVDLPPRGHRLRVLDVGHGTGIWVYEMAESTPHADVIGIDLHSRTPVREQGHVANASFATPVDFMQPIWPVPTDSHDLIHLSQLCGSVPDWSALYQTVSRYLRPGIGHVEHTELDWEPRCVGGHPFPPEARDLQQWWSDMRTASHRFGKPMDCPDVDQVMQRCGLVDVSHRTVQISLRPRRKDERDHKLSWAFKLHVCCPFDDGRVPRTLESLTMSLFTRELGMQPQAVFDLCDRLRTIICIKDLPVYFNLYDDHARFLTRPSTDSDVRHVWTARRPRS